MNPFVINNRGMLMDKGTKIGSGFEIKRKKKDGAYMVYPVLQAKVHS